MNKKGFLPTLALSAILIISVIPAAALDSNWHQFQKDEINIGVTYSPAPIKDVELAWSAFTYGSDWGNGIDVTPIIADDMVYIYAANGSIWAFNKTNGNLIWQNETTGGNLQTSTPAYGDGKIFVAARSGDLFAFNATTGEELWNVYVTDKNFECPIIYFDHKIYIGEGLKGGVTTKYYYCYDDNGTQLWNHSTDNTSGFLWCGASVVADYLVYATHEGKLISLYKNNGTLTDEVDLTSELSFSRSDLGRIRASVTYHNGYIYTTSEKGQAVGYVFKVGFDNGTFVDDGWSTPNGFSTSTPVVYDGKVYVGQGEHGYTGNLTCLNDSTGEIIWSYFIDAGVKSSPAISIQDGKPYIYFTGAKTNGSLYCLNVDGTLGWNYNPPDEGYILQGAAISDGRVYFGTDGGYLYCIEMDIVELGWEQFHKNAQHTGFSTSTAPNTNNTAWISDNIGAYHASSVTIAEGRIFVYCWDYLACLDEYTGEVLWNVSVNRTPDVCGSWVTPVYNNGFVFLSAKETCCFNATDGFLVWMFEPPTGKGAVDGGCTISSGMVFTSDWDGGHYYCLNITDGTEIWNFTVDGKAQSTPAVSVADDRVFFCSYGGICVDGGVAYSVNMTNGDEIWNFTTDNSFCGSVTIGEDVVYLPEYNFYGDGALYALYSENGTIKWNKTVQRTDSTPVLAYGNVYVCGGCLGFSDLMTYCFNATNGDLLWNTSASDKIGNWKCSVAVADGKVFVGKPYFEGGVMDYVGTYALDAFTGNIIWSYPKGGSSPAIADGMVFTVGSGKVYAFGGERVMGDLNNDGEVTTTDAFFALKMAVRGEWQEKADMNRDDKVTSLDALMIMQVVAGSNGTVPFFSA
ncbi:MAG: Outer membrane protein assembly factor BamB [Candidatus Argoarchaeum ethanivorans]|uniref:Outer membrane protein assembly factor BamB n=1 Tax=Candidatus Argoarchaeum ethanivorans TaxID=2608793 RepID=A0A811TET7_9EURY|nr:MAG: Outer membrane protein assembly factor BamB [Candidatus Argoarchaeum ethanivorans]